MFKIGDYVTHKVIGGIYKVEDVDGENLRYNLAWHSQNLFKLVQRPNKIQRYHFKDVQASIQKLCNDAIEDGAKAWVCNSSDRVKVGVTKEIEGYQIFDFVGCYYIYWIKKEQIGEMIGKIKKNLKSMKKPKKTNFKVMQFIS